ncbi:MAG: ABC transporter permease, partial [Anaerolineae bacterium]|nr:ABC transporter permease [Anaerolineae bacterium]
MQSDKQDFEDREGQDLRQRSLFGLPLNSTNTGIRVARFTLRRIFTLGITIILGVYCAILIANLNGFVDEIFQDQVEGMLMGMEMGMQDTSVEERAVIIEQARFSLEESFGLHDPFLLRTARWLVNGVTFNWGEAERLKTLKGDSSEVNAIILERLPNTLLIAGLANLLVFFSSLYIALNLSRKRGGLVDRIMVALSPLSTAPSWIHGVLLIAIFAAELHLLPFSGMLDSIPPDTKWGYALAVGKHMILPVSAVFLSAFFQGVYAWRSFFLTHAGEEFVEMAEAKGLPTRMIDRDYLMRPTLPAILTNFTMMLISFWQGAIALEILFFWPGIGSLFWNAIVRFDRPVVVGVVVIFAYLLGLSVFLLDFFYALVDPRIQVNGSGENLHRTRRKIGLRNRVSAWLKKLNPYGKPQSLSVSNQTKRLPSPIKAIGWREFLGNQFLPGFRRVLRYPSAVIGLIIILFLFGVSIYATITLPYDFVVTEWRRDSWLQNPKNALPTWVNLFRETDLPRTITLNSLDGENKEVVSSSGDITDILITFEFVLSLIQNS